MPDLDFRVLGVEAVAHSMAPLLHFKVRVTNVPENEVIQGLILQAQIQLLPVQRSYSGQEQEKLVELFGLPERWGQTLRSRLWGHSNVTLSSFRTSAEVNLPLACSYDLNILATRYAYALEGGDIPLLFLFSGSVFYLGTDGRLQVQPISWNQECSYRMPVHVWRETLNKHFPNTAWLTLREDVFERLYAYRRREGTGTWEATIEKLLEQLQTPETRSPEADARDCQVGNEVENQNKALEGFEVAI